MQTEVMGDPSVVAAVSAVLPVAQAAVAAEL